MNNGIIAIDSIVRPANFPPNKTIELKLVVSNTTPEKELSYYFIDCNLLLTGFRLITDISLFIEIDESHTVFSDKLVIPKGLSKSEKVYKMQAKDHKNPAIKLGFFYRLIYSSGTTYSFYKNKEGIFIPIED